MTAVSLPWMMEIIQAFPGCLLWVIFLLKSYGENI